jgi:2-amino-4-hydroxy-6-hydroxymethyldihydropteridine diphosphokinase
MHNVILSLGSNLGNRINYLNFALTAINEKIGKILSISSIYETEPFGFQSDNNFLNICISVETALNPSDILNLTQKIEHDAGRTKKSKNSVYHSRTLDIDIISIDDFCFETETLTLPHPHFSKRKFVLIPMLEICPNFTIHKTKKTISQILRECKDETSVKRVDFKLNFPI